VPEGEKRMTTTMELMLKVQSLSEEQQRQVLDFINRLPAAQAQPPRLDLYGLFKGFNTTEEEIAEARREMWGNFPREDF
jgi:hypothetical protein